MQPLYMGCPYDPVLLSRLYEAERAHQGPLQRLLTRPKQPTLTFRAGPLPPPPRAGGAAGSAWACAMVAPMWAVPGTVVAGVELACALAAWRLTFEQALSKWQQQQQLEMASRGHQQQPHQQQQQQQQQQPFVLNDAVLSGFRELSKDEVLLAAFLDGWGAACKEMRAAQVGQLVD